MAVFRINRLGESLRYRVRGRGECLLLLHGLGSSSADWELQIRALERHFRVIAPDLPGGGYGSPASQKCSIPGLAEMLWSLLDHLRVARVNVVGFSLGGAVALEMALQRPDSVPRLVLINSLASYKTLTIAAEHDYTPLEEKLALAAALRSEIVVVRGSRHGTPFDSIEATHVALLAVLSDRALPWSDRWVCDEPQVLQRIALTCQLAEEVRQVGLHERQCQLRSLLSRLIRLGSRGADSHSRATP